MEYLPGGLSLEIPEGCFPLSTDSVVLAHFAKLPRRARVLDLGSGCGTIGLLLCASSPECHVTGLELSSQAHAAALANIQRNGLDARMSSICCDLRDAVTGFSPGSFEICISNPPYFSSGSVSQRHPDARQELHCSLQDLMAAAGRALKYGGDFYLVHRPDRLGEIISAAAGQKIEAKRIGLLRHRADVPISLVLIQLRKGGRPGLILEDLCLFDQNNEPTSLFKEIYHI